jgi:hypothetical protein
MTSIFLLSEVVSNEWGCEMPYTVAHIIHIRSSTNVTVDLELLTFHILEFGCPTIILEICLL